MFDKLRRAMKAADDPVRAVAPPTTALVPVPVHRPGRGVEIDRPEQSMGYMERGPDSARAHIGMTPILRTADMDVRSAWPSATAHARSLMQNSGFLAGGVELICAWTVGGDGLQPNISPDADALGWEASFAKTWASFVEARFKEWSHDPRACDSQGRMKFGAMQNAAMKSYLGTGDILSVLDYGAKSGSSWKTSLNMIDPTRLWVPPIFQNKNVIVRDGVEHDERGRALAYHIRPLIGQNYGDNNFARSNGIRIPTFSASGKQLLVHAFDADVGAVRGISPLAAAIQSVAQSQNVHDAAVLAAHVASMIVGIVTSDLPTSDVARSIGGGDTNPLAAMMEQRVGWHEQLKKNGAHLQLGHGAKIAHLSTGERFDMLSGKVPFTDYEKIIRLGLAEAARAIGIAPEHLTGLKNEASYSALKVAAAEARAIVDRRRKVLIEPLCEFALASVTEEMIADGRLPWPGRTREYALEDFRAKKQWALKTEWTGPQIEDPDTLRATRAAIERVENGLSSITDEIAATGKDPEAVMRQRQHDEAMLLDLDVALPWSSISQRARLSKGKKGTTK